MKVREIMTAPVLTVRPDNSFAEVVDCLLRAGVSGAPVVDTEGQVLGIVTEADLVTREAYGYRRRRALGLVADYLRGRDPHWVRKSAGRNAADLMTVGVESAAPDEEVAAVARRMLEHGYKRLPVIDHGRLIGMLTRADLLRLFHRKDIDLAVDIERLLRDPLRAPETHQVHATVVDGVVTLEGTVLWPNDVPFFEAVVAKLPGVVAVENRLSAREAEPTLEENVWFG